MMCVIYCADVAYHYNVQIEGTSLKNGNYP